MMVDHTFVYHPAVQLLKDRIKSNEFGDLLYYDSVRVNFGKFQKTNVLWDLAPHDLSILQYFLDNKMPRAVSAVAATHLGVEGLCYITLTYDNGFVAHLHVNWMAPVKVRTIMVGGSKKMALYDDNQPAEKIKIYDKEIKRFEEKSDDVRIRYRVGDMVAPVVPDKEALANVVSEFSNCIENNRQPVSNASFGRNIVRILEAATESVKKQGLPIPLNI